MVNRVRVRLVENSDAWDELVARLPSGNILQSSEWGDFKRKYGWSSRRLVVEECGQPLAGAQLLLRASPAGALAYLPRGPLVDFAAPQAADVLLAEIHRLSRRAGAVFLKAEPDLERSPENERALRERGFVRGGSVQPTTTLVVDLRGSEQELRAGLSRSVRYNIGLAQRKGVRARLGEARDLPAFYQLLVETARRGLFAVHPYDYYVDLWQRMSRLGRAHLVVVEVEGKEPLAATMFLVYGQAAYQFYGASSSSGRRVKPNELLQWHALLRARELGCLSYDLWGVPEELEEPDSKQGAASVAGTMQGVYHFKRGFGGKLVRKLGSYDYVYSPTRYWISTRVLPGVRNAAARALGLAYPRGSVGTGSEGDGGI